MIQVICPVCGAALAPQGAAWRCVQGHCFDVARQGYVNLLTVTQKHSRHPGDTREMVAAPTGSRPRRPICRLRTAGSTACCPCSP